MGFFIHFLCLVGLLSRTVVNCTITDDEEPKKTFPIRRAIDGTRGRKYYDPEEDNPYDDYGSSSGRYDSYEDETDLSDIRNNVPGEPGVDYPAYTRLPQTEFVCEDHFRGYYADEGAGCQVFHVCDGSFLVSSFVCPIGSIFSQKLLTCDWWNKVDCSSTRNYHAINAQSHVSEVDDDEILRKAFEMARVQSAGERIPVETVVSQQQQQARHEDRKLQTVFNYGSSITERINDLPVGQESYSDYADYPSRFTSRHKATFANRNHQRHRDDDYYSQDEESKSHQRDNSNPSIKVHTIGEDRKNDRSGSFRNEFQPSYAPTVPTVVTTARKFYSPTIPTTPRPSTTRDAHGRYDLEFESSDHLYTARGRSEETVKAATPSSHSSKVEVESVTASLPSFINSAAERDLDKMEQSESSHKIHSPTQQIRPNFTESSNDTIIPHGDHEEAVQGDSHRSTEKITEKISILTIDNENLDPTVFSYDHGKETNPDGGKIVKDGVGRFIVGDKRDSSPLDDSNNDDDKPSEFLQPPSENQSIFRITVLDDNSTWNNGRLSSSQANLKTDENCTEQSEHFRAPATVITPPLLGAKNDLLESRIIRIVFNNNLTGTNSSEKITEPSISDVSNATDGKIHSAGVDAELEKSMSKSTSDSTESADFISPTTPADSNSVIEERKSSKSEDSPSTKILPPIVSAPTTESPNESIDSEKSIYNEDIFSSLSNSSKIDDTIELGSSPFQVTLTLDKNGDIDPSGDEIRKLIAEQDVGDSIGAGDFKIFEIVRSNEPHSPALIADDRNFNHDATSSKNTEISHDESGNFRSNKLQSMNYLRSIVDLINGPNSPRPFSFGQPDNFDIKTSLDENDESISSSTFVSQTPKNVILSETTRAPIRTTESIVSSSKDPNVEKSFETLEVSSSGFARDINDDRPSFRQSSENHDETKRKVNEEKSIFELPETRRFLDFETGLPLRASEQSEIRIDHEDSNRKSNETNEDSRNVHTETVVETEFVPSLGFSLNTEEEREKYMEAVVKGLLDDVTASEKTSNETDTSLES